MKQLRILIIGAGIAGLSTALALSRKGFKNIAIFEQAPELGEIGAGIQLGPNAVLQLDSLGLAESLKAVSDSAAMGEIRSGVSNQKLADIPGSAYFLNRYGVPGYQLLRMDLHQLLLGAVVEQGISVQTGKRLLGTVQKDGEVLVSLTDGSEEAAGLVIGADGVGSVLRAQLFPDAPPEYSGFACWRGLIDRDVLGTHWIDSVTVWADEHRHMVAYPVAQSQKLNLVAIVRKDQWQSDERIVASSKNDWLAAFKGFDSAVLELIKSAPADGYSEAASLWGLFEQRHLLSWHKGQQLLMGDAAHAMLPNLAQGAGQSIEDAVLLAELLDKTDSIEIALQQFFELRHERVRRVQTAARWNLDFFHQPAGLQRTLRNTAMRMASSLMPGMIPTMIGRKYDWLYKAGTY